jgi:hypothetical protein
VGGPRTDCFRSQLRRLGFGQPHQARPRLRLCEHTMRVPSRPSKEELSTWLARGTFYLAPTKTIGGRLGGHGGLRRCRVGGATGSRRDFRPPNRHRSSCDSGPTGGLCRARSGFYSGAHKCDAQIRRDGMKEQISVSDCLAKAARPCANKGRPHRRRLSQRWRMLATGRIARTIKNHDIRARAKTDWTKPFCSLRKDSAKPTPRGMFYSGA